MSKNLPVLELAVTKNATSLNPHNPRQIAKALDTDEYENTLFFDDDSGELDPKSLNRALKRLAETDPYLFKNPEVAKDLDDGRFRGKEPGGSFSGRSTPSKEEQLKAEALARMGIK